MFRVPGPVRADTEKFAMAHGLLDTLGRIRGDESADGGALRSRKADNGRR